MSINSRKKTLAVAVALLCASAAAGFYAANYWSAADKRAGLPDYEATVLDRPRPLPAVDLIDKNGHAWQPQQTEGAWQLLFFGFTHCPDICPITLTVMRQMHNELEKTSNTPELKMQFVSVDPQRDTPQAIKAYVDYFDSDFGGLTGDMAQIRALTAALYLPFSHTPDESKAGYRVDHSAALVLVNPQGEAVAYMTPPHDAGRLAKEAARIMRARRS